MFQRPRSVGALSLMAVALLSPLYMGCENNCTSSSDCAGDEFCSLGDGACLGASARGLCKPKPDVCPAVVEPVCGCDGTTYNNTCEATRNGASVASVGACRGSCGGPGGAACAEGLFCDLEPGTCGDQSPSGTCRRAPEACPSISDPVCGCDGTTYASACEAARQGVSVAAEGACNASCGGPGAIPCAAGLFCDLDPGTCGAPSPGGVCRRAPDACPSVSRPVCGCDGTTYENACEAARQGVSVAAEGACEVSCGGQSDIACAEGLFCDLDAGTCGAPSPSGVCRRAPEACPDISAPVCGCDGTTYENACEAARNRVSVRGAGECPCGDGCACDFLDAASCPLDMYCAGEAGVCLAAGAKGRCTSLPSNCPQVVSEVCGCNNTTYANACVAAKRGRTSVALLGPCVP
jgi:Kazal-type serine protease inhibitor domain